MNPELEKLKRELFEARADNLQLRSGLTSILATDSCPEAHEIARAALGWHRNGEEARSLKGAA